MVRPAINLAAQLMQYHSRQSYSHHWMWRQASKCLVSWILCIVIFLVPCTGYPGTSAACSATHPTGPLPPFTHNHLSFRSTYISNEEYIFIHNCVYKVHPQYHSQGFSSKDYDRGGGKLGFVPIEGAVAMICSKWSGYTANSVSFWAVGIATYSICRHSLELLHASDAMHPALWKRRV